MDGVVALQLTHLTAHTEHHAVGAVGRIVHSVLVGDQRTGPPTQVEQVAPIRAVPCQTRHFQADDNADLSPGNSPDEFQETVTRIR